jgi:hypothetical protein
VSASAQAGLRLGEGCGCEQDCEQDCRLHTKTLVGAGASFFSYAEHVSSLEWYTEASPCQVDADPAEQMSKPRNHERHEIGPQEHASFRFVFPRVFVAILQLP